MTGKVIITYEFNLTCGHICGVEVDGKTYEPPGGVYICPECGAKEWVPRGGAR